MLPAAVAAVLTALLGAALAGCAGDSPAEVEQFGGEEFERPCAGVASPFDTAVTAPAGFPAYDGWQGTLRATQGKTVILFGRAPGDDVAVVQARQRAALEAAGLRIVSTDREGQAEAEISFDGTSEGTVQITPLCQDMVAIRYKLIR